MTAAPRREFAVVLNRRAGVNRAADGWPRLRGELAALDIPYRVVEASGPAEALAAVWALPPDVALMTVGGDGTVASVLPAVIEQRRPLMILPFGTGNDFAGTLQLAAGEFSGVLARHGAVPTLVDALQVRYGLGPDTAGERLLLNGLGMGFDAHLTARLPQAPRWLRGLPRYLWAALVTLREMQWAGLNVTVGEAQPGAGESHVLYRGPAMLAAVMNGRSVGGGFRFVPAARVNDGRLDVVVAARYRRAQVPALIGRVLRERHLQDSEIHHAAARSVELRWDRPVYLHLDGDVVGQLDWLQAQVRPGVVPLLNAVP